MAVTVPSDLELLDDNALSGHIAADKDPLHTLLRRTNWLYSTHAPAIACGTVTTESGGATTTTPKDEIEIQIHPSADGLDYTLDVGFYHSGGGTDGRLHVDEKATWGGSYTSVTGSPWSSLTYSTGDDSYSKSFPIASTTRFLRIGIDKPASDPWQIQWFVLRPKRETTAPSTAQSSGWIPYEDAALTSAGAPIHTEYLNRCAANAQAVYSDRRQVLLNYVEREVTEYGVTGSTNDDLVFLVPCFIPGNSDDPGLTARVKFRGTGGASGYEFKFGQLNGNNPDATDWLKADSSTDHAVDLTVKGEAVWLYGIKQGIGGKSTSSIDYLTIDVQRTLDSVDPLVPAVAPPPQRTYLTHLDDLTLRACLTPYAMPGLFFDHSIAGGTYFNWGMIIPPAVYAVQGAAVRSTDGDPADELADAEFWLDPDTAASDKVIVPASIAGTEVYPLSRAHTVVDMNGIRYDASPSEAMDRLVDLTADREPQLKTFHGQNLYGWGCRPLRQLDVSAI